MPDVTIVSEKDACISILKNPGSFVPWIGAGVSIESRIPGSQEICDEIAKRIVEAEEMERKVNRREPFKLTKEEEDKLKDTKLNWNKPFARYASAIRQLRNEAERVEFFRKLVAHRAPSFGHYATALLTQRKILAPACITTNFDKLIERAFFDIGVMECQPIRTNEELTYVRPYADKAFCIKIHGDYDTHNLMNTADETFILGDPMIGLLQSILRNKGLIVIGAAGFEKSIHTTFDKLTLASTGRETLEYGLLWGIYIPEDATDPEDALKCEIKAENVSNDIVEVMRRARPGTQFAFFPVRGGAGEFMRRMVQYSGSDSLIQSSEPYFDHEMRIRELFLKRNLSRKAAMEHIKLLRTAQKRIDGAEKLENPDWVFEDKQVAGDLFRMSLCYGSLADPELLAKGRLGSRRAGILSPDDTFISIGGGTALAIANAAGYRRMVHDVSKLAPIALGEVAVTTAGNLPVEYILHGASIEIVEEGPKRSPESIRKTVTSALKQCSALEIDAMFVPLLAAGTGGVSPTQSVAEIFAAISAFDGFRKGRSNGEQSTFRIIVVVFREAELSRSDYQGQFDKTFARAAHP
jgi:O-acetyl-ADP-ribose deacetylase